jgi:hypothetical protein
MQTAVTEDKALLGSNLSAGDGPKLAGAVHGSLLCAASSGVFLFPPALLYWFNPPSLF